MHARCATLDRRRFIQCLSAPLFARLAAGMEAPAGPWDGPAVVAKLYLGGRPGWPRPDLNLEDDIREIETRLAELERRYPGQIRFTGGETVRNAQQTQAWLERAGDADVILAFNLVTIIHPMLRALVESGKPTLLFARPYAGHDWTHAAIYIQRGARLEMIASSDFADLDPYLPLFRTVHHLRHSRVLLVSPPTARPATEGFTRQFGTQFGFPSYLELKAAYDAASATEAEKLAREFIRAAVRVVEPGEQEIASSVRLYLGLREVLRRERANAIAIDCLGGFGRGELPAYPCIAFSKFNDAGLYGVCENDLDSAMTQLLVTSFSGKPGFVTDPVFDTSRNEVIHAHCVAATRLRGLSAEPSPYLVRSHLEDHKGASLQVLAPAGDRVTVARFAGPKKLLVSTGEAVGNVDDERGCRTKIRTKVADARKLLLSWSSALNEGQGMPGTRDLLHRVLFYGDHLESIERLGRLLGFQVIHEG
ncbi:MAG: hypothetical protein ACP5U2_01025 [Bryobacteraceae bacterium]